MTTSPPQSTTPTASFSISSWQIHFHAFSPSERQHRHRHRVDDGADADGAVRAEGILLASIPLSRLYPSNVEVRKALDASEGDDETRAAARGARVALADYAARTLSRLLPSADGGSAATIETMGRARRSRSARSARSRRGGRVPAKEEAEIPYVLERTDCAVVGEGSRGALRLHLRADASGANIPDSLADSLAPALSELEGALSRRECFGHVAAAVLQRRLRGMLRPPRGSSGGGDAPEESGGGRYLDAVAFVADGSVLPRRSGRSHRPMPSPPAVPFRSPEGDALTRTAVVEVGWWRRFLNDDGTLASADVDAEAADRSAVSIRGMIIPLGVTLIVGGGYHGKSTLLRCISVGVYDKIPGTGTERCVTHPDALCARAEDGRYVNRCNVSAFISNLPAGGDTSRFSTRDASGSTSQASNVVEGLESGASAFLVDEDVSAANFMARDGRMRAMIMDEPITPLLYRVNGLYLSKQHNVSTVIVVGGVGEWLDVADAVILMKDYVAYDGLKKARSVSYQFSYNHVQYGGRGVVHRLPWKAEEEKKTNGGNGDDGGEEKKLGTLSPLRRRPDTEWMATKFRNMAVHLLDSGSSRLWFYPDDDDDADNSPSTEDDDDDDGIVDMSKCSQLLGNASEQLYGCGICILWLLRESMRNPQDDIPDLLQRLEAALDAGGMNGLMASLHNSAGGPMENTLPQLLLSNAAQDMWEDVGFAYRPRIHEVAMTLTRMRGLRFEILPDKPRAVEMSSEEEEQKRKMAALAEMWSNRRKK